MKAPKAHIDELAAPEIDEQVTVSEEAQFKTSEK